MEKRMPALPRNRCITVQRTEAISASIVKPMQYAMTRFGITASQERSSNAMSRAMTVLITSIIGNRRRKKSITESSVPSNGKNPSRSICRLVFIQVLGSRPMGEFISLPSLTHGQVVYRNDRKRHQTEDQREGQGRE